MKDTLQVIIKQVTEIQDGRRKETVKLESDGKLYIKDQATIIAFEENLEHVGNVKTMIKIKEDEVLVMRTGAVSMRQVFRKGEETVGEYKSQAGKMQMRTKTEVANYQYQQKNNKGKIVLAYRLNLQGEDVGRYRITLSFKEGQ